MVSQLIELDQNNLLKFRQLLVVGDLHGDIDSLYSILKIFDPSRDCIIFLGDYADRGTSGVKVIDTIDKLFMRHPKRIFLLRGNHEYYNDAGEPGFFPCDLISEVEDTKDTWQNYYKNHLKPFLQKLKLSMIIPENLLFVHGGISSRIGALDDLRFPSESVIEDVLWSDPFQGFGERPNLKRGGEGVEFGSDVTSKICELLGVKRIIRSHEPLKAQHGPSFTHDRKLITVNSTRVYGGSPFVLSFNPSRLSKPNAIKL